MKPINNPIYSKVQDASDGSFDRKISKKHGKDLGLGIPENYFSKSKGEILALTSESKKSKTIQLRKVLIWMAAAGIALIFTLSVFNPKSTINVDKITTKISDTLQQIQNNHLGNDHIFMEHDEILIASLFLNETEIDKYADDHFIEEIIIDEYIDNYFFKDTLDNGTIFN